MRIFICSIYLLFLGFGCDEAQVLDRQSGYDQAVVLYEMEQYDETLAILNDLIVEDFPETQLMANIFYLRGFIYYLKGSSRDAYDDYILARSIFEVHSNGRKVVRLNNDIGQIFYELELYDQALVYFTKAYDERGVLGKKEQSNFSYGMAKTFAYLKKFDLSLEYYLISLRIDEEERNYPGLCDVHLGLGSLQRRLGNLNQALKHYNKVLDLANLANRPHDIQRRTLNNIGFAYYANGKYLMAKKYLFEAIEIPAGDKLLAVIYNNLGQISNKEEDYVKAWAYFKKSVDYNSGRVDIDELSLTNEGIRKMYKLKSQPDSLLYYTMKINDLAMPIIEAKEKLTSDDEKMALLTKYQDYQVQQVEEEQQEQLLKMAFWIVLFAIISGFLGFKLWNVYAYHTQVDKHKLLKNSSEMVYLLDLFKNEKDELKRMMDQQL